MIHFQKKYVWGTLLLLLLEIAIAVWKFHPFVRGFVGDVLVVLLLFCFLKIFLKIASEKIALGVLFIAFTIEVLQAFKISEKLQITSEAVKISMGSTFDVWDLVAYSLGYLLIYLEIKCFRRNIF
ncbi:ribosomal maturation YjgA family protein [Cochleicola gelatinilyticus]|uniref:DUF2809 domain-containing protein n=1 Tax=Cochleicola gelatinilyticus TaxID=1763537 RepID=A0A167KF53_9FLAO|nr:DUF2809 domain-containing protein [Cochleicola gelatinilyticus]OAB81825.1 hypothetical protein ULVI_00360 [Cochleicola gelatinilyticus]